jgi:hypothetical protein
MHKRLQNNKINFKNIILGVLSVIIMFIFLFIFIRLEDKLQEMIFNIDKSSCLYFSQRGIAGFITIIVTLIFSFFTSATLLTFIMDKKDLKKIVKIDLAILLILIVSLLFSIQHYQILKNDGIYIRDSYLENESFYSWDKVIHVDVSFYNNTKDGEHLNFKFIMPDKKIYSESFKTVSSQTMIKNFFRLIKENDIDISLNPDDVFIYKNRVQEYLKSCYE